MNVRHIREGHCADELQARMGSRRLPGKVLADLGGVTVLGRCIYRLRAACVGPVIVATTALREDDDVVREARRHGAAVVRGAEDDVLDRFITAADTYQLEWIIRATADNPFVDIDGPARVRSALFAGPLDHVVERGLPYGAAVEAIRVRALRDAARRATLADDREHVTPWLKRETGMRLDEPAAPSAVFRPDIRLTIDTDADLQFARSLARVVNLDEAVPLAHIINVVDSFMARLAA
jgi:spore coat polysaccharide biosynthesis protein SpsF